MTISPKENRNGSMVTGTLLTIGSALIFGLTPMLNAATYEMGSNPITMTFYRNFLAIPILFIILKVRKVPVGVSAGEGRELFTTGTLNALTSLLLFSSYSYIGVGLGTTLHFLYPVFTILIGYLFFKDRLGKVKIVALVMAVIGMAMATGSSGFNMFGVTVAAVSGITYAGYMLALEKTSIGKMDNMKAMMYITIFSSIVTLILSLFTNDNIVFLLPPKAMVYTVIFSVLNSCVAHVMLAKGVKIIGAGNASIYSMFEPVSSVIGGVLIRGESQTPLKAISCIVIFTAVTIPAVSDIRDNRK